MNKYRPYFVVVANKIDKYYEREVSKEEGEELAEKFGCGYIEASAKTGISVQKVFFDLVRILRGARPPMQVDTPPVVAPARRGDTKKDCILM
jgi:GTPase KRas protein